MLEKIKLEKILFLDVETVPQSPDYISLTDEHKEFWNKKAAALAKDGQLPDEMYTKAGIYAEFGKIICISFGMFYYKNGERHMRIKSLFGHDEKVILQQFADILVKTNPENDLILCAHNGKEFDFPYISRRMLIHAIKLPQILDIAGKKPWETQFLDTMELWKFGDHKNFTSLNLLAYLFDIPSPKSDIDGSQVAEVYYKLNDIERISKYCQNDVRTIMQLLLKFKGEKPTDDTHIEYINS